MSYHKGMWKKRNYHNYRGYQVPLVDDYAEDEYVAGPPNSPAYSPRTIGCLPHRQKYSMQNQQPRGTAFSRLGLGKFTGKKNYEARKAAQQLQPSSSAGKKADWFEIRISRGREIGREFIIENIADYVETGLHPIFYHMTDNGDAVFFLEDKNVAEAVRSATRRIDTPRGFPMVIFIKPCYPPFMSLSPTDKQLVEDIITRRLSIENAAVNLSDFNHDQGIEAQESAIRIQRNAVMHAIIKALGSRCSALRIIDMSHNSIRQLDFFAGLTSHCPNVSHLMLSNNNIDKTLELEKLFGWKRSMIELSLGDNPVCAHFKEPNTYITAIRKIFPKVEILDGIRLPPPITFDLDEVTEKKSTLPIAKPSFYVNDKIQGLVLNFIVEYYTVFDSGDRQKLLDAYANDALFTLTAWVLEPSPQANFGTSESFRAISKNSHNIKQQKSWERFRERMVQRGRLDVVSTLAKFPKTIHDPNTFLVDVSFAQNNLICFAVTGLFKEADDKDAPSRSEPTRAFNRVFLIVPSGEGVAIVNDELFLTLLDEDLEKKYLEIMRRATVGEVKVEPGLQQTPQPMASLPLAQSALQQPGPSGGIPINALTTPLPGEAPAASSTPIVPGGIFAGTSGSANGLMGRNPQELMLAEFMKISGMKPEWAQKCLVENEWDYQKAVHVFSELKKMGSIPAEAFA